uniref:Uncharacterized protein n=1 Tax=Romanomermis culicivorax TaxID=13658 RepID=A0A915KAR4_ROMCU
MESSTLENIEEETEAIDTQLLLQGQSMVSKSTIKSKCCQIDEEESEIRALKKELLQQQIANEKLCSHEICQNINTLATDMHGKNFPEGRLLQACVRIISTSLLENAPMGQKKEEGCQARKRSGLDFRELGLNYKFYITKLLHFADPGTLDHRINELKPYFK